ncbi:hypothetical protein [Methylosinus sporium]|nr:hypothetical protein [Methylosinus sporium]
MGFDLSELDTVAAASAGAWMDVTHPTTGVAIMADKDTTMAINLVGDDSDVARKYDLGARNRRLAKIQPGRPAKVSAEQIEADEIDRLASRTIGWRGVALDGADVEFSAAAAKKLYTRFPWLRVQVAEFIEDRANFLKV